MKLVLSFFIAALFAISSCNFSNQEIIVKSGVQSINGTELFVKTMGKGEPILIVHGGPGLSHDYYLHTLNRWLKIINSSFMINEFQELL